MTLAAKAVWIVERNLRQLATLTEIADACGVSSYHLAHAFGEATGNSVMQYVRGRRLSEAAKALASGAPDILGLALDTGYNSHEAFSRAFRAQFGVTPEMVRRTATTKELAMIEPIEPTRAAAQVPKPRFEAAGEILAVGLGQRHPFGDPSHIPRQWRRFMETMYADVPFKRDVPPISVSGGMDDDGNFEYVCAAEVTAFGSTPKGLIELNLAPQTYAVFLHAGHVSEIGATYAAIWNEGLPATGRRAADASCVERHRPGFDPQTGSGGVEIWIPVVGP